MTKSRSVSKLSLLEKLKNRRTWANPQYENFLGEVNNEDSQTIPGQGYEVKDLITKYTRGERLNIPNKIPQYAQNPTFDTIDPTLDPNFQLSDYTEIQNQILTKREERKKAKLAQSENEVVTKSLDPLASEAIQRVETHVTTEPDKKEMA